MTAFNVTRCTFAPLHRSRFLKSWLLLEDESQRCGWTTDCGHSDCGVCVASLGDNVKGALAFGVSHRIVGIIERIK